jgi:hypothetical protein
MKNRRFHCNNIFHDVDSCRRLNDDSEGSTVVLVVSEVLF